MSRVITGSYRQAFPDQPPAPRVTGELVYGNLQLTTEFLLDTGADWTVLSAGDARRLFGREGHRRLRQLFPDNRVSITGVGTSEAVEVPLTLAFRIPGERPVIFRRLVLVLTQLQYGASVRLPSLLGRDILNRFTLFLNPATETVELTELDLTPAG